MRRRIASLFLILTLMAGLTLPVQAADPQLSVCKEGDGSYTVQCAMGAENAGAGFSLKAIDSAKGEQVLYLAQATADESGTVSFTNVHLLVDRGVEFVVSGGSLPQPLTKTVAVPGTVVMGRVTLHGRADSSGVAVTFTKVGAPTEYYTYKTRYDGSYQTDALPEGAYHAVVTAEGYQDAESDILLSGDMLLREKITFYIPGDVNKDNKVDNEDITALLDDFGKHGSYAADINGDGYVNGTDLALLKESIEQIIGATPSDFHSHATSLSPVQGQEGVYKLTTGAAVSHFQAPVRRMETMVSWDATLLTLADSTRNYTAVTPEDGANQSAYPGVVDFVRGSGGAVFLSGTARNACYLAVSCEKEEVLPQGELYFRLKPGKTENDLHKGSVRIESDGGDGGFLSRVLAPSDRYGALIGYGGTVMQTFPGELVTYLTYPNSDKAVLASLEIQSDSGVLTAPPADSAADAVLALTAVGYDTEGDEMELPTAAVWSLVSAPRGVTLVGNELHADKTAPSGNATVRAVSGSISAERAIAVSSDLGLPSPTSISIKRGGTPLGNSDSLKVPASGSSTYTYTAAVLDQYGLEMAETDGVGKIKWSLTTADNSVSHQNGLVTVAAGADLAKSYVLTATAAGLSKSVTITLVADGGGGGGSGGGGASAKPEEPGVSVSGDSNSTTVKVETTQDKDGSYTAVVSDKEAAEILKAAANKSGPVVITMAAGKKNAKTILSLPKTLTEGLGKSGGTLTMALPAVSVELSPKEMEKISTGLTVSARQTEEDRTEITVDIGGKEIGFTAIFALEKNASAGLVAMLVEEDGTLAPVRKSVCGAERMAVPLSGSATVVLKDNSKPFADMAGSWAADSVAFVSARELFSGTTADAFSPMMNMSRGMLATVLYRLEGEPVPASGSELPDIEGGSWYADGASWCVQQGIITGKSGGAFDPEGAVTREELALMLYRLAAPEKTDPPVEQHAFVDAQQVSPWAGEAMEWALSVGLITGKGGGRLDPGGTATRAEVAAMLERFVKIAYGEGGAR